MWVGVGLVVWRRKREHAFDWRRFLDNASPSSSLALCSSSLLFAFSCCFEDDGAASGFFCGWGRLEGVGGVGG